MESKQSINELSLTPAEVKQLFLPQTIYSQALKIYELCLQGETNFIIKQDKISKVAAWLAKRLRAAYPDLAVPLHSRWQHYASLGLQANSLFSHLSMSEEQQAKALIDLTMVSVLLDAGAGADWTYHDKLTASSYQRSEGLAIAVWRMFAEGLFANDLQHPLQVDGEALLNLTEIQLASALQVTADNPLQGLSGRLALLQALGAVLINKPLFSQQRPADLVDYFRGKYQSQVTSSQLVQTLLESIAEIWPNQLVAELELENGEQYQQALGDVAYYLPLASEQACSALVPFHKLCLWLSLSLIHPLEQAGIKVLDIEALPGLAEYRNGGLMLDSGLLALQDTTVLQRVHKLTDPIIIEWRALTVVLLQQLKQAVCHALQIDERQLTMAQFLEGASWQAGRELAFERSPDGAPPLRWQGGGILF